MEILYPVSILMETLFWFENSPYGGDIELLELLGSNKTRKKNIICYN